MKLPGYRLGVRLRQSEHSAVYRAVREQDGLPVVIKTLSREYPLPAEVRRLEFEFRMLDELRGPRVVEALGLARTGGQLALILADFGGSSLPELGLPVGFEAFFQLAREVTLALGHIHARDVIHNDIRPHHLIASSDGARLQIIDFQLASEITRGQKDVTLTHALSGTLPYLSPERTGRMNRAIDHRSDYYSLGVTFFELLTGELPYSARDVMDWVHCHICAPPPELRERVPALPSMLSRLVAKLMAKEPRDRYQSSRGLLADLERCEALRHEGRAGEEFSLGSDDFCERFVVSKELFGRDTAIRAATNALTQAASGPAQLLLVAGPSGVGKSSAIRELYKPLTAQQGYFAAGKCDPPERSLPCAGLVEALRHLVRQLLGESDARVRQYETRLRGHLGASASVLTELAPELAGIIGPQPAPPPIEPYAAQNRIELAFARFIEAIATEEHPLLFFLDDLEWADATLPALIANLFVKHDVKHVLIAGAYRDDEEMGTTSPSPALRRLREAAPNRTLELRLEPLSDRDMVDLVASTLKCAPSECLALGRLIHEETDGSPLFASELLWTLYRREAIVFSASTGRWTWDLEAARTMAASPSFAHLLLERLGELHDEARGALQMAACLHRPFTLSTLAGLLGRSPDATALSLRAPVAEGWIVPLDDSHELMQLDSGDRSAHAALAVRYVFRHDRMQQAAYSLIADSERAAAHLSIGRRLLATERDPEHPDDVFAATHHLNLGRALMTSVGEREQLAKQNRKAAAKALVAAAFSVAARHHDAGAAALSAAQWSERPELRFALFSERVGSVLLAGEHERAAALCDELFALAPTTAARAAVYLMKSQIAMHRDQRVAAIDAVRQGLRLLAVAYPEDRTEIDRAVGAGIGKMQTHLARVPIDELAALPECTDAEKIVALRLLCHVVSPALRVDASLAVLAGLIAFDLMLTFGTTDVCAKVLVDLATLQCAQLGDPAAGHRLGKASFRLLERYDARPLSGQVHFAFAANVSHWGAPYAEALHSLNESRRCAGETGDHQLLAESEALRPRLLLTVGQHLSECAAAARAASLVLERIGAQEQRDAVQLCQLAIEQLSTTNERAAGSLDVDRLTRDILCRGNPRCALQHGQLQMLVNVLLGDWDAAVRWSEFTRPHSQAAPALFIMPEWYLLECLITTQCRWPKSSEAEQPERLRELERHVGQLQRWSDRCPENFAHKYLLAAAEVARVKGEPAAAVGALYEQAIKNADQEFLHLRALASELFGQFLLGLGRGRQAEPFASGALALYARWGAEAKVQRLKTELDGCFPHARVALGASSAPAVIDAASLPDPSLHPSPLDPTGLLSATRAISSEMKTDRVLAALMKAILEHGPVQRARVVLDDGDQTPYVRARADLAASEHEVGGRHPLENEPPICQQVVRSVMRSLEPLVIDDVSAQPTFSSDDRGAGRAVKSALGLPMLAQGRLVAVLYVENDAVAHAFTRDRVEVLGWLGGQAAISLANAARYEDLERRLAESSRVLAAAPLQQALGAIESALAQMPERPSYPVRALTQVKQVVHRLNAIPLDQVLRETSRVFPSLARELGKSVPELEWVDDGTLLDAEWGRVMKDALVHTFRNSLDHGIETCEEREALGKAPRGKIALFTERDGQGVRIHLRDDGRGLPIAELRNKTGRLDGSDQAIAEAIFDYGVSSAQQDSHVFGRGLGMDAVRGVLRERGGDVAIAFTGDARAGYRPFELVFRLPNDAMIAP
jgi:predicted ATPase